MSSTEAKPTAKAIVRHRAKVLAIGPDGRNSYTADRDARAGWRTATNEYSAGPYIGRELHIGVAVPDLRATDTTSYVSFGRNVPRVVLLSRLVPAGSHRGDAVREAVLEAKAAGFCAEIIADAAYSLARAESLLWPLQQANIPFTLRPKSHQRGEGTSVGPARVFDGQLFSRYVPEDLADLRLPKRNATPEERQPSIRDFERRAAFRYGRHKAPGVDGTTQWEEPFHAGRLRSRRLKSTMRKSRKGPLVPLPKDHDVGPKFLTIGADQLPLMQPTIVGTSAWWAAWGRRNIVETVNSQLHGGFIDIGKGYVHVLDTGRIDGLLAHGLAGYNRYETRQFKRVHRLLAADDPDALPPEKPQRKPRGDRLRRFEDLPLPGRAPPDEGQCPSRRAIALPGLRRARGQRRQAKDRSRVAAW